jgi:hypothetical protein
MSLTHPDRDANGTSSRKGQSAEGLCVALDYCLQSYALRCIQGVSSNPS